MDQYIGKMLDNRYEILEVIGTGGMAVVYRARCHRLNRLVAIKILRDDLAKDAEFRRRFHDESQAVAMLSHPNIMAVYDVSRSSDVEYIVMELIDGITLKQYMQKKGAPLNWREALHFITQIMKALSHAHSRGIIHRDIKPQNIMVLRDGSVKVADFGIARLASAAQNTLTQEALGSVHYISPEQARGSRIDARSDIYSAGVVLYEMLTGRLPFEGDTPVSVAIQHINSIPLPPRELNPDIPEALESITMKAMAPNVENRYASADAMLSDLEEFRKNPSINFEYTPSDLFPTPGVTDEPTQIIDTHRRKAYAPASQESPRKAARGEQRKAEDDDDPEEYRSSARKHKDQGGGMSVPLAVASILVFVVGIGVLLWVIFFSNIFASTTTYTVPKVTGMTLEEAREDPDVVGRFTIVEGEKVTSDTVPVGQIVSQEPAAHRQVGEDGLTITVNISAGTETITMPPVVGKEYREALVELQKYGLRPTETQYEASETITENYVIRTTPAEGTVVVPGDDILVVISSGPAVKPVTMLPVVGQMVDDAKKTLEEDLHLSVKVVTMDSDKPEGLVLYQSIASGTEVDEGTTVTLQVSNGSGTSSGETPSPSESTNPGSSSQPEDPSVNGNLKSKDVEVSLPSDGEPGDIVQVRISGKDIDQSKSAERRVGNVHFTVWGTGTQEIKVYIDGDFIGTVTVNFDT